MTDGKLWLCRYMFLKFLTSQATSMTEKICRLCLQSINIYNCKAVEESLLKALKLNINICKENVMCVKCADECAECLQVFSNFTSGCAYMEDKKLPLSDLDNGVKLDPEAIETTTKIKCSFCTKAHGREDLVSLVESKENKFMVNMLKRYISETNLKNTEELLSCVTCLGSLEGVLSAILKCLEVEERISEYIVLEGTDDKGQVELEKVQRFTFKPIVKSEIESFGLNELQDRSDQDQYTRMAEAKIKYEREISNTELIIKTEGDIASAQSDGVIPDIKSEPSDCDGFQEPFNPNDPLHISVVISEMRKCKNRIKQHLLIYNRPFEIETFKCELCSYETKHKVNLRQHLLVHKSPSKIKMFNCELCPYETKHKASMKRHLLTHKSPSEIKMFKCELCSYEAKHKWHLKIHLLTHKNPAEIKMFKCAFCSYEAKQKCHLETHLLTHKPDSEIKMFKCELCSHETKRKCHLKSHLLTHKSHSEIKMFKCESCSNDVKSKSYLRKHLLIHKDPSEVNMFKCASCSYATKRKQHLVRHLLTHKSPSELQMFKCESCLFETKHKCDLKNHSLTHKSPSEIKMFKCDFCSYEAKMKSYLRIHLLTHKSPSELEMFKCTSCSYQAKRKQHLTQHLLTHRKSVGDKNV